MAFLKKKSRFPLSLAAGILFLVLVSGMIYVLYHRQADALKTEYEEKVHGLVSELYQLERQVYIPREDIGFGTVLSPELFRMENMKLAIPQNHLADDSDMGKVTKVSLPAGLPVMKSALSEDKPPDDLRKMEFNMFLIQTGQSAGDYVDVRILFPNGENYIILGKKQLKGLNLEENIVWLWLDETEIHRISSAIIDAYLHEGTKIYVSTYILPELQEAAVPFYPSNPDVLDLMKRDPNILKAAEDSLAREMRALLETNLEMMAKEDSARVSTGVQEEISKTQEMIIKASQKQPDATGKENGDDAGQSNSPPEDGGSAMPGIYH